MKLKKILAAAVSATMAVGCMAYMPQTEVFETMTVEAEKYSDEMSYGDYLSYKSIDENEDGKYDYIEITDCDESVTEVEIPTEIDGLPVTTIGDCAFCYCKSLESIIIPDSVTSIGDTIFAQCTNLASVTISDNVTRIAASAFFNCTDLTEINIPDGVTSIGGSAFSHCTSLTEINIPDGVTSIGVSSFEACTSLTSITLPDSVTNIGQLAFSKCDLLTSITIENPECEIYDSKATISNGTIYGYENSTAQVYAEKYGYTFESLGEVPVITTPAETTTVTTTTTTQTTVSGTTSTTPTAEPNETLQGDANGDSEVNVRDAAFIASALANGKGNSLPLSADFNGDKTVNVRDAAAIAAALAQGKL